MNLRLACLPNHGCLRLIEGIAKTVLKFFPEAEAVSREHSMIALKMLYGTEALYMERLTAKHVEISRTAKVA